jgi:hypothetical protein
MNEPPNEAVDAGLIALGYSRAQRRRIYDQAAEVLEAHPHLKQAEVLVSILEGLRHGQARLVILPETKVTDPPIPSVEAGIYVIDPGPE